MQKTITAKELSRKIGISYSVLQTHLCRFGKYSACTIGAKYTYNYTKPFLQDLKKWYELKQETCNYNRIKKYYMVIKNLEKMIAEFK